MADRDIIIGRVINVTGMIGVLAGLVLFAFVLVLLIFRRGLGFDIVNSFRGFGSLLVFSMAAFRKSDIEPTSPKRVSLTLTGLAVDLNQRADGGPVSVEARRPLGEGIDLKQLGRLGDQHGTDFDQPHCRGARWRRGR
jgi:hypothetical protein